MYRSQSERHILQRLVSIRLSAEFIESVEGLRACSTGALVENGKALVLGGVSARRGGSARYFSDYEAPAVNR